MSKHRNFVFTQNNYPDTDLVDTLECRYIAYGKEVASTGTPHLQGFVCFKTQRSVSAVRKSMPGCHVEVMHGTMDQNTHYCNKEGSFIERGDRPVSNDNKGRAEKLRYQRAWEKAKSGLIEDVDADIRLRLYSTLKAIAMDYMVKPLELEDTCGIWIWGSTGTGKTHCVTQTYPNRYIKNVGKQWNGYQGEEVVHMDELSPSATPWIGHFLKLWADKYPFQADIKYGAKQIRPKLFIITSNYSPDQMGFPPEDLDPILRRFKVVNKRYKEQKLDLF